MLNEFPRLVKALQAKKVKVYLVGGAVRDMLRNKPSHDLDFVVMGDAPHLAKFVADQLGGAYYLMDTQHGIARVLLENDHNNRIVLDFSVARGESFEADLRERDFTINAIAYDLESQKIIDPLGGSLHLRQSLLKACSPDSFSQDPIRVLRAIRFSLYLNLKMDADTKKWLQIAAPQLARISGERVRDELFRLLGGGKAASAVRLLQYTGLMERVLPEIWEIPRSNAMLQPESYWVDLGAKTLQTADTLFNFIEGRRGIVSENLINTLFITQLNRFRPKLEAHLEQALNSERSMRSLLCLSGLFFPIAATQNNPNIGRKASSNTSEQLINRLKFFALSTAEIQRVRLIIENAGLFNELAHKPEKPEKRAIHRYFRRTGAAGIDICLLSLALYAAQADVELDQNIWGSLLEKCSSLFEAWWLLKSTVIDPAPLITGNDLMDIFSIKAGVQIGLILELVREEQAAGGIQTRREALDYAKNLLEEY